ncbi:MAG TPA: 16S rRNA (uracil(1498)-N(3))-methyltransferase [Actinomycetaceae bacterium]|nr:16S rRNA (uracil(1498)-N(3))-methyltransferase [Actinomycetaceae bacterium]
MSPPVFLARPEELAAGDAGTVTLVGEEARHAIQVRRLRPGEVVDLVDGAGRRVRGAIAAMSGSGAASRLDVAVSEVSDEPALSPRLVLAQALAKGGRDEQAIAMACEVGIDGVIPWQAQRSIVRWEGPRAAKGRARWESAVVAAAKQSRRAWLPSVAEVHTSLAAPVAEAARMGGAALVLHERATTSISEVPLPECPPEGQAGDVVIIVGPEGGITDEELAELSAAGAQAVRLGPHVLRSGTAGVVATAHLSERLGRWAVEPAPAGE